MSDSRERFETFLADFCAKRNGLSGGIANWTEHVAYAAYQAAEAQAVRRCVEIIEHPGLCLVEARRHIRAAFPHAFKE